MVVTRKKHRLAVRWNPKDKDTYVDLSPRFTDGDMAWILSTMFNSEHLGELQKRGYNLASLRFHIDKTPEAILEHERRAGRA